MKISEAFAGASRRCPPPPIPRWLFDRKSLSRVCTLVLMLSTPCAFAAQSESLPGGHVNITHVAVHDPATLVIVGEYFDFGAPLKVSLGGIGDISATAGTTGQQRFGGRLAV